MIALAPGGAFRFPAHCVDHIKIRFRREAQGERFSQPELFNAMLRMWLGPQPADGALKNALLDRAV